MCVGLRWFVVVCGGLWWFVVDCGGLSFSHTAHHNHEPSQIENRPPPVIGVQPGFSAYGSNTVAAPHKSPAVTRCHYD